MFGVCRQHVERLKRERLAREMEEGYRAEAESPSLDPIWYAVDGDAASDGAR